MKLISKRELLNKLAAAKHEDVLKDLRDLVDACENPELKNEVTHLSANYHTYLDLLIKGLASKQELSIMLSNIGEGLIEVINKLKYTGQILYYVPKKVKAGSSFEIIVRIAANKNDLLVGLGKKYKDHISKIPIEPEMQVKLHSNKKEVQSKSSLRKTVPLYGFAEWKFLIHPPLKICKFTNKIEAQSVDSAKVTPIFEESFKTKVVTKVISLPCFVKEPKIIIPTILLFLALPIFIFLNPFEVEPVFDLKNHHPENTYSFNTVNYPWIYYGHDFGKVTGWDHDGISSEETMVQFRAQLEKFRELGVRQLVWHLFADGRAAPEIDSSGIVAGFDDLFFKDMQAAISLIDEYELSVLFVLVDFKWFYTTREEEAARLFGNAAVINDPVKRQTFYSEALVPLLKILKRNPAVNGWIIINEPDNAVREGLITHDTLKKFIKETSQLIHQYAPLQRVSVGNANLPMMLDYFESDLGLDFLSFHQMSRYKNIIPPSNDFLRKEFSLDKHIPIYIGEYDLTADLLSVDNFVKWYFRLGYSGAWPWSINDLGNKELVYEKLPKIKKTLDSINFSGEENWLQLTVSELDPNALGNYRAELIQWLSIIEKSRKNLQELTYDIDRNLQSAKQNMETDWRQVKDKESRIRIQDSLLMNQKDTHKMKALMDSTSNAIAIIEKKAAIAKSDSLIKIWEQEIALLENNSSEDTGEKTQPLDSPIEIKKKEVRQEKKALDALLANFELSKNYLRSTKTEIERLENLIISLDKERHYARISFARNKGWKTSLEKEKQFIENYYLKFIEDEEQKAKEKWKELEAL